MQEAFKGSTPRTATQSVSRQLQLKQRRKTKLPQGKEKERERESSYLHFSRLREGFQLRAVSSPHNRAGKRCNTRAGSAEGLRPSEGGGREPPPVPGRSVRVTSPLLPLPAAAAGRGGPRGGNSWRRGGGARPASRLPRPSPALATFRGPPSRSSPPPSAAGVGAEGSGTSKPPPPSPRHHTAHPGLRGTGASAERLGGGVRSPRSRCPLRGWGKGEAAVPLRSAPGRPSRGRALPRDGGGVAAAEPPSTVSYLESRSEVGSARLGAAVSLRDDDSPASGGAERGPAPPPPLSPDSQRIASDEPNNKLLSRIGPPRTLIGPLVTPRGLCPARIGRRGRHPHWSPRARRNLLDRHRRR